MPIAMVNGLHTHYCDDDFSPPWEVSEPVWIQHGYGRNVNFWFQWVAPLVGQYRVLRCDLRGHGDAQAPPAGLEWTVENLLADMIGFLDAMDIAKIHYVGESVGGILGVAFAATYPDRLASMTLVAAPTQIHPRVQQMFAVGRRDWVAAVRELGGEGWAAAVASTGGADLSELDPTMIAWGLREWARTPPEALAGLAELAKSVDITPLLGKVTVPTLLLAPANSTITSLEEQVQCGSRYPRPASCGDRQPWTRDLHRPTGAVHRRRQDIHRRTSHRCHGTDGMSGSSARSNDGCGVADRYRGALDPEDSHCARGAPSGFCPQERVARRSGRPGMNTGSAARTARSDPTIASLIVKTRRWRRCHGRSWGQGTCDCNRGCGRTAAPFLRVGSAGKSLPRDSGGWLSTAAEN
jgi:pimeloyl-ACP methyl ester carboxylesterase